MTINKVHPLFLTTGVGMIAVGLLAVAYGIRVQGGVLAMVALGGAAWFVSVTLKMLWAAKTNRAIITFLKDKLPAPAAGPLSWVYVGALTGIFECGLMLLLAGSAPSLRHADWADVLTFGIGFGAAEAVLLGLFQLLYVLTSENARQHPERYALNRNNVLSIPLGIFERAVTLFIHIFTGALVVLAVQQSSPRLFWYSFIFKTLVDTVAAWLHLEKDIKNVADAAVHWRYQLIFAGLGAVSFIGLNVLNGA
ncbi:MAG: YhfC family intramembrane metalloprotease [Spirochaetales bacterium]|nr:YhfC family intramembrane metalloprotease [Spirochaetales bacterium]